MWCLLTPLVVSLNINWNIAENNQKHKTTKYENARHMLIGRRGDHWDIRVNEPLSVGDALLLVEYNTFARSRGSRVTRVAVVGSDSGTGWRVVKVRDDVYRVYIPSNADIGIWQVDILRDGTRYQTTDLVSVLFNPFSRSDQVYISPDQTNEYIFEEKSRIWMGTYRSNGPFIWIYDQFSEDAFYTALYLLTRLKSGQNDVVSISRYLSRVVNANSGFGILIGKWRSPYTGGTHPSEWHNSRDILRQFRNTLQPVRYAQCWVFGAVLTTLGRTLGIPSRTITNFGSAHEYKGRNGYQHSIDEFYGTSNKMDFSTGSIWNFHVWTEMWMKRDDLNAKYSGWQAVDATPQETSFDGYYNIGPASVSAIKDKVTTIQYDNDFVYGEVASTYNVWVSWNTGNRKHSQYNYWLLSSSNNRVGLELVTQTPNSYQKTILTGQYKSQIRKKEQQEEDKGSVSLRLNEVDSIYIGDILMLSSRIQCKDCHLAPSKKIKISMLYQMLSYNGEPIKDILDTTKIIDLRNNEVQYNHDVINTASYELYLKDSHTISYSIFALVYENETFTGETYNFMGKIELNTENLYVRLLAVSPTTELQQIYISFTNPLNIPLTNIHLKFDGLEVNTQEIHKEDIPPHGSVQYFETVKLKKPLQNVTQILVYLHSAESIPFSGIIEN